MLQGFGVVIGQDGLRSQNIPFRSEVMGTIRRPTGGYAANGIRMGMARNHHATDLCEPMRMTLPGDHPARQVAAVQHDTGVHYRTNFERGKIESVLKNCHQSLIS
jgi:hypothetical protein